MQKIVNYLLEVSFIAVLIKSLIFIPGISEALILITLIVSMCYKHLYLTKSKLEQKEEIDIKLAEFKNEVEAVKNAVMSVKMSQNMFTSTPKKPFGMTGDNNGEKENLPSRRF